MNKQVIAALISEWESSQFPSGPPVEETGLSIAVIRDGKSIDLFSFGFRDRKNKLPVTPSTVFPIASLTKSITAFAIVDTCLRKNISLTDPIRNILPLFQLLDPAASAQASPLDILSHRCALPRHDGMWYWGKIPMNDIFDRLRFLEVFPESKKFRKSFQYNNLLYGVMGLFLQKISGKDWKEWVSTHVLQKLGIDELWLNYSATTGQTLALPYFRDFESTFFQEWTPEAAACMFGTAHGLAQWLVALMGSPDISEASREFLWSDTNDAKGEPESTSCLNRTQYGLGWFIDQLAGERFIHHGGLISGSSSFAGFLPEQKMGVVVLSNQVHSKLPRTLTIKILEKMLGQPSGPLDRFTVRSTYSSDTLDPDLHRTHAYGVEDAVETHSILAGKYEHPAYGIIEVKKGTKGSVLHYRGCNWPVLSENTETLFIGMDWIGMPSKMKVGFKSDSISLPLNRGEGLGCTTFKRQSNQK